jgi:AraC-like DNA-binding protein
VDRYERAVDRMIERVRRADARAACPARRARGFVDTNVGRPISTASVARAVACSETHLCVLFREAYGTTVGNYIRRRRIERAKALLAATHLPVKTVAHQSGFATYRTFLRNFRGLTGLSPRRYRRLSQQHGPAATSADGRVSR